MKKQLCIILLVIMSVSVLQYRNVSADTGPAASRIYAIQRIVEATGQELPDTYENLDAYSDCKHLSDESKKALSLAIKTGIVHGYDDGTIRPEAAITRAECAQLLFNATPFFSEKQILEEDAKVYADVPAWASEAVTYCLQRGFMLGYGDVFGCWDHATREQVDVLKKRLEDGLTVLEKYTLLDLSDRSPINLAEIMKTGHEPALTMTPEKQKDACAWEIQEITEPHAVSIQNFFDDYFEIVRTIDYHKLSTEEAMKEKDLAEHNLMGSAGYDGAFLKKIQDAVAGGVNRESFFVSAPENYGLSVGGASQIVRMADGYEYFTYHEGAEYAAKEAVEVGKWYRRRMLILYHRSSSTGWVDMKNVEPAEELPAALRNR